jgi:hypothetical protein
MRLAEAIDLRTKNRALTGKIDQLQVHLRVKNDEIKRLKAAVGQSERLIRELRTHIASTFDLYQHESELRRQHVNGDGTYSQLCTMMVSVMDLLTTLVKGLPRGHGGGGRRNRSRSAGGVHVNTAEVRREAQLDKILYAFDSVTASMGVLRTTQLKDSWTQIDLTTTLFTSLRSVLTPGALQAVSNKSCETLITICLRSRGARLSGGAPAAVDLTAPPRPAGGARGAIREVVNIMTGGSNSSTQLAGLLQRVTQVVSFTSDAFACSSDQVTMLMGIHLIASFSCVELHVLSSRLMSTKLRATA